MCSQVIKRTKLEKLCVKDHSDLSIAIHFENLTQPSQHFGNFTQPSKHFGNFT